MSGPCPARWGWTAEEWEAAVETEVVRSCAEQGLPHTLLIEDEATLDRVARLLTEDAVGAAEGLLVASVARGER